MIHRIIEYKDKDGHIRKHQYKDEDHAGYFVLVPNRKKPKHIKFSQVIGEEKHSGGK